MSSVTNVGGPSPFDDGSRRVRGIGHGFSGPGASAMGASDHSGGILSGNVVNVAASVPLNICGNQVEAIAFADKLDGSTCSIG